MSFRSVGIRHPSTRCGTTTWTQWRWTTKRCGPNAHVIKSIRSVNLSPSLTFDGNDMLADLVLQQRLVHALQELVDGVDVRMDGFKSLDLGSDCRRIGEMLLIVHFCS